MREEAEKRAEEERRKQEEEKRRLEAERRVKEVKNMGLDIFILSFTPRFEHYMKCSSFPIPFTSLIWVQKSTTCSINLVSERLTSKVWGFSLNISNGYEYNNPLNGVCVLTAMCSCLTTEEWSPQPLRVSINRFTLAISTLSMSILMSLKTTPCRSDRMSCFPGTVPQRAGCPACDVILLIPSFNPGRRATEEGGRGTAPERGRAASEGR